jgi:hypothetical protein
LLTGISDGHGWHNSSDTWTPAIFEAILRDDVKLSKRADDIRDRYFPLIFPAGLEKPSLRTIPMKFRAIRVPQVCRVMPSAVCGDGGDGVFAIATLPIGTTWLFGGAFDRDATMDIKWYEYNVGISLPAGVREGFHGDVMPESDDGIVAWKVNEPPGEDAPNAVMLTSIDGVYLTICKEIVATPEKPQEIFVDYGKDFPRVGYTRTRYTCKNAKKYADKDWERTKEAMKVLASVPGIQLSKYYAKAGKK